MTHTCTVYGTQSHVLGLRLYVPDVDECLSGHCGWLNQLADVLIVQLAPEKMYKFTVGLSQLVIVVTL